MQISAYDINEIILSGKSFAMVRIPGEKKIRIKSGCWKRFSIAEISKKCFFVQPFSVHEKGFALIEENEKTFWYEPFIPVISGKKTYLNLFRDFHSEIERGNFKKLILSKVKKGSAKKINIGSTFLTLCEKFPKAAVNLFHIPGEGLWMGASPELLIKSDLKKTESMSLAGTLGEKQKEWTNKEWDEQKAVTDFILEKFKKISSNPIIQKRKTIQAGNVKHLCNHFISVNKISWNKLLKLVSDLHPTPAVNGLPKEKALKFISTKEKHSREFYAGYFGFIEPGNKAELYVNIRCMKLVNNIPYIFSGGGIIRSSSAVKEWTETELKAKGLINSLSFGEN